MDVDAHNQNMLEKFCKNIRTFQETNSSVKSVGKSKPVISKHSHTSLQLAINARVMITRNISVVDGITNGVTGRIVRFIENNEKDVSHIVIKCDSSRTGKIHRTSCKYCRAQDTICVMRESNELKLNTRKQFPLRLSWAMTVHKA